MEVKDSLSYKEKVLQLMPYDEPFRFIDEIEDIDENGVVGHYTFHESSDFYRGHFPGFPLTPGVILTECMAQIGLVALGIHLIGINNIKYSIRFAFASSNVKFLAMVEPGERVTVKSKKVLWRMGALRCDVSLYKQNGEKAAEGTLTGYRLKDAE